LRFRHCQASPSKVQTARGRHWETGVCAVECRGAIRNDDDLNAENTTQPEMDLKLTLVADTALSEGLKSFIIALDIKGARQPWSQSINISPQVATFELIADLRSGIHEQPPGLPGVCGRKVTVISDNSLAAKADRLVIDGAGIPKGITVLLKDSSGIDRPLPVDVVGDNATFDVLIGWDATKIRKEELATLTQSMKLQLRPAVAGGAKVASERSQAHLPQLAFEPIVRATIDADWGFEAPKIVEPTTPRKSGSVSMRIGWLWRRLLWSLSRSKEVRSPGLSQADPSPCNNRSPNS
jgi:hypothetical protein